MRAVYACVPFTKYLLLRSLLSHPLFSGGMAQNRSSPPFFRSCFTPFHLYLCSPIHTFIGQTTHSGEEQPLLAPKSLFFHGVWPLTFVAVVSGVLSPELGKRRIGRRIGNARVFFTPWASGTKGKTKSNRYKHSLLLLLLLNLGAFLGIHLLFRRRRELVLLVPPGAALL